MILRQHERERALLEQEQAFDKQRRHFWHNVLVMKVTVMLGLGLTLLLPPEHAQYAGFAANLLWLWKT